MAHPRAPDRARHRLRAGRRAVRSRRAWRHAARADLRRRRDRRPVGDAAAGRARRPRVRATCSRTARTGGRSPITACVALDEIHRCSSCISTSRATTSAFRSGRASFDPARAGPAAATRCFAQARADRLRVLAGVAGEPDHAAADRLANGIRLSVAAPAAGARGRAPRRSAARPRSSTGVATCTASPRCSSVICRTTTPCWTSGLRDRMDARALRRREGADPGASRRARPRSAAAASACGADRSSPASACAEADLAASLASGWTLARDVSVTPVAASPLTPMTRLAPSIRVIVPAREREPMTAPPTVIRRRTRPAPDALAAPRRKSRGVRVVVLAALVAAGIVALAVPLVEDRWPAVSDALRSAVERVRGVAEAEAPRASARAGERKRADT